jgi:hypothetical protein
LYQKAPCNSGSLSTFKIRVVAIKKEKKSFDQSLQLSV